MYSLKDAMRKAIVIILSILLIIGLVPTMAIPAFAAEVDTRIVDPSTIDNWERYFGEDVLDTQSAGGIWTDKSVFKDATALGPVTMDNSSEDFLVALSAIAANKEIKGYSYIPTDTMLVLDVSGSMKQDGYDKSGKEIYTTARIDAMVEAANKAIQELLELNNHNRVGVVLYSGNTESGSSNTSTASVILPLDRYTTSETKGSGANQYNVYLERSGDVNNMQVRVAYTQSGSGYNQKTTINVTDSQGNKVSNDNNKTVVGGTYIQNGIYKAWQQFSQIDDVVIEDGFQAGQERIPIMVLMSDGAPTTGTTSYTNIGTSNVGNGQSKCATDGMGFITQLTASWARIQMESKYNNTPKFYTLGLGIDALDSGGNVAESVLNPNNSTSGIRNYWNDYNEGTDTVRINAHNSNGYEATYDVSTNSDIKQAITKAQNSNGTIKMPQYYVDQYFEAENAEGLITAFDSIVDQIILQSKYYPTEAEFGDHDLGGYISFEDAIGEFMEVKDVKGLLLGDTLYNGSAFAQLITGGQLGTAERPTDIGNEFLFSLMDRLGLDDVQEARDLIRQAYLAGQISYTDANTYSNYASWYADANGDYLGFAPSNNVPGNAKYIMKSYGYLGYGDITQEESIAGSDLMYMTVRVQEEIATGRQTVQWAIPASLIPTVTYEIELEGEDYETAENIVMKRAEANPVRLVYEVGLIDGINELTIADFMATQEHKHMDAAGNYEFYTNRWGDNDLDGKIDIDYSDPYTHTVTVVDYTPSLENERYYYTEDSTVYAKNGDSYTAVNYNPNSRDGDYYHIRRVFTVTNPSTGAAKVENLYEPIMPASLAKATRDDDGTYFIPAGTILRDQEQYILDKNPNVTETMQYVVYPAIYNPTPESDEGYHEDVFLGNNGKMTITPATGIKLTKTIDTIEPGTKTDGFQFTIELAGATLAASYPYQIFNADGAPAGSGNYNVNNGKIVATLSAGQTVFITDLPPGATYKVVEEDHQDYIIDKINGEDAITGDAATGTITARVLEKIEFENTLKTHGNLIIGKVVTHPLGESYQMPEKQFNVTVQLDGTDVGKNVNNIDVQLIRTGETQFTTVQTSETGSISFDIKHGETVSIHQLPDGVTYKVVETDLPSGFTLDKDNSTDLVGTISKDVNSSELLVNNYIPGNVYPVNITLTGEKNLEGRVWIESDEFTFALERFDGARWSQLDTETVTKDNPVFEFTSTLQGERYTSIGTYQYRVRELGSDANGITYDKTIRYFDVTVTDIDMDGELEIQPPKEIDGETVNYVVGTSPTVVTYENEYYNVVTDFNNKYAADTDTYIDLNITKTISNDTNIEIPLNGFYFALYEEDGRTHVMSSDETNALGATYIRVVYEASEFAKENGDEASIVKDEKGNIIEKTYKYVLKEIIPDDADKIPGMTYNEDAYQVTVVVKDNLDGKLSATVSVDGADVNEELPNEADVTHNNTYDLLDANVSLEVYKHLDGAPLDEGDFTFELYAADENWAIYGSALQTVTNDAGGDGDGVVDFDDLTFSAAGTYYYILREHVPDHITDDGITYDTTAYKITVVVTQKVEDDVATNELETDLTIANARTGAEVTSVTFANSHVDTDGTSITLEGEKKLAGRDMITGEFGFRLYNAQVNGAEVVTVGEPIETVTNTATGKFIFAPIAYEDGEQGIYYYIIREVNAGNKINGVTYAKDDVVVRVEVSKEDTEMVATATVLDSTDNKIVLENTYNASPVEVQLTATKTLKGRDMAANEFEFQLLSGTDLVDKQKNEAAEDGTATNIEFEKLTFDKPGTYNYIIKEVKGQLGGVTYDEAERNVVIKVTDNGKGELVAVVTIDGIVATNTDFVNTYGTENVPVVISGTKTLVGRDMVAGEFWFDLRASNDRILQTKGNTANGTFTFDAITYEEPGNYTYTVVERNRQASGVTYDSATYTVEVTVVDNGEGKLVATQAIKKDGVNANSIAFENYDPVDTEVVIKGIKKLDGREMLAEEFSFQLFEEGNAEAIYTVKNSEAGKFEFPKIIYKGAGTFTYLVKEVLPLDDNGEPTTTVIEKGMTYDDTVYTVVVTVADDGTGKLVATYKVNGSDVAEANLEAAIEFENKYVPNATTAIIDTVNKALAGREIVRGEFEFKLTLDKVDGQAPETVQTPLLAKNGMVWDAEAGEFIEKGEAYELEFNLDFEAAGVYEYIMEEVIPEGGVKDGVTYDTAKFKVVIEVIDDGEGKLIAGDPVVTKLDESGDETFNNTYEAKPVTVKLTGTKDLEGKELEAGQFEFKLYDEDEAEVASVKNGNVVDGGIGDFEISLTFEEIGEYRYTLREVNGGEKIAGITYDENVYEVFVKVTDDGKGQLVAETTIDGNDATTIEFINEYTVDSKEVDAVINVNKVLVGRDMEAGEFTFELKDADGEVVATGKNEAAKDGEEAKVVFEKITYNEAGEYVYTLTEVAGDADCVSYSKDIYEVIIEVVDNGDGTLSVEAPTYVNEIGVQSDNVTFTNNYYYTDITFKKLQAINGGNPTDETIKVEAGDIVTYYLVVTNAGNAPVINVEIADRVPAGLEVVDGSIDNQGVLADDGTIRWEIDKVEGTNEEGDPGTFTVSFKVKVPEVRVDTTWQNVGTLTYTDPSDNPDDPENPDNPNYEKPSNPVEITEEPVIPMPPATGDNNNTGLWTAIMALAATGFLGVGLVGFKKKEEA